MGKSRDTSNQNSLTKENIEKWIMYTLRIKDLEKNTGINYKNYSGAVKYNNTIRKNFRLFWKQE